jgi:hypothetical protein
MRRCGKGKHLRTSARSMPVSCCTEKESVSWNFYNLHSIHSLQLAGRATMKTASPHEHLHQEGPLRHTPVLRDAFSGG